MATKGRAGIDPVHRALIARVRELARKKHWSANRLADFSGIARGYLSDMLAGRKSPTVRTLSKIARALEVSVRDLFA